MSESPYPEHEKLTAIQEQSQRLGEFLDWLDEQGYFIAQWRKADYGQDVMVREDRSINEWLADFHGIDLDKIYAEKEVMYQELRRLAEGGGQ